MTLIIATLDRIQQARAEKMREGLTQPRQLGANYSLAKAGRPNLLSGDHLAKRYPGVTFLGDCKVDGVVAILPGTVVESSVIYGPDTQIGRNTQISSSQIENCKIGDSVTVKNGNLLDTTVETGSHVLGGHVDKCTLTGQSLVGEHASVVQTKVNNSRVYGSVSESDLTDTTVYVEGNVWQSALTQTTVKSDVGKANLTKSVVSAPVAGGQYKERDFTPGA